MNDYSHLLSPITLRGKTFRNRMLAVPTGYFSFANRMDAPYYDMLGDCHAVDRVGDANLDGYIAGDSIV